MENIIKSENQKVIIFDGVDCSGKSTIIETFMKNKEFRNSILLKNGWRPSGNNENEKELMLEKYSECIYKFRNSSYEYIIIDRSFMSEMVYSFLRGYDELMSEYYIDNIQMFCDKNPNHLYIVMQPDWSTICKRYAKRGDEHVDLQQIRLLYKRYENAIIACGLLDLKILELKSENLDHNIKLIKQELEANEAP